VDLFFVLSGFLITGILYDTRHARNYFRSFYARRILGIFPLYYAALAVMFVVPPLIRIDVLEHTASHWPWFWLYASNVLTAIEGWHSRYLQHFWSLAIEEQFYLVFPLFLLLVFYRGGRARMALLVLLLVLAVSIRAWVVHRWGIHAPVPLAGPEGGQAVAFVDRLYTKPYTRYGALLSGVIAAAIYRRGDAAKFFDRHRMAAAGALLLSLAAIGVVAVAPLHVSSAAWPPLASMVFLSTDHSAVAGGVAYLLLYALYPAGPLGRGLSWLLCWRLWYPIAQLSYSAYLLHPVVLERFYAVVGAHGPPAAVLYVVGPALSLLAASALYVFVERPFMNLRDVSIGKVAAEESQPATV
jgi:peptidoglycan/LPS O-acetylase OafA/YrhL